MLHEAGIMRSECYVTNVCKVRPPGNQLDAFMAKTKKDITPAHTLLRDKWVTKELLEGYQELLDEVQLVQPNLIITFGNLSMWALTGQWGVLKWRGSQLSIPNGPKLIPTIHPAAVLREWSSRALVVADLRRAKREMTSREYSYRPAWLFHTAPSFTGVCTALGSLITALNSDATQWDYWLDFDIETKAGHIDCIGLSWSRIEGICIPFVVGTRDYWSTEEEAFIIWQLYRILTHPRVKIRWQNGLYDAQYVHRHWHFIPRGVQDTMISQHSLFAALPKGLSFLASMYAQWYVYWKDEGKLASDAPLEQRWRYNLQDCVYTRECGEVLADTIKQMGLEQVV